MKIHNNRLILVEQVSKEKMKFKSLKEAKKYIKSCAGGEYTICLNDDFAIINETIMHDRHKKMVLNDEISCNVAYLRVNGEFI